MEVVGSAVGITSLGIQVCQGLVQYLEAWRGYSDDMRQVRETVNALGNIFEALEALLRDDELDPAHRDIANGSLQACFEGLRRLEDKAAALQSSTRWKAHLLRSVYPIKKQTLQAIRTLVGNLTGQLQLALTLIQLGESRRTRVVSLDVLMQVRNGQLASALASTASESTVHGPLAPRLEHETNQLAKTTTLEEVGTSFYCDGQMSDSQMTQLRCFMAAMGFHSFRVTSRVPSRGSATAQFPVGLLRIYDEYIDRICGQRKQHHHLATRIFTLLVFTVEPVKSRQLRGALSSEPGGETFDEDGIADVCGGLVVYRQAQDEFHLIHITVKEYLEEYPEKWLPGGRSQVVRTARQMAYLQY